MSLRGAEGADEAEADIELNDELDEEELAGFPGCRIEMGGVWPRTLLKADEPNDRDNPSSLTPSSYRTPSSSSPLWSPAFSRLAKARPASFSLGVLRSFFPSFLLRPEPASDETALDAHPATLIRLVVLAASDPTLSCLRLLLCAVPTDRVDPRELGRGVLAGDPCRLTLNPTSPSSSSSEEGAAVPEVEEGRGFTVVFEVDEMEGVERPNANACGEALRRGVSGCWIVDLMTVST
jgi:hypothetical protein